MNPNTVSSKCKFLQALPVSSEKADLSARPAALVEMTGMALSRSLHAACGLGRDDRGTPRSVEMTWVSFRAEHASCHFERSTKCAVEKSAHPTWLETVIIPVKILVESRWKQSRFSCKPSRGFAKGYIFDNQQVDCFEIRAMNTFSCHRADHFLNYS